MLKLPEERYLRWGLVAFGATSIAYAASLAASAAPPWVSAAIAGAVVIAAIIAFARRFELGMAFVLAELAGGSLGQLFGFGHGVSIRMALFAAAFVASAAVMIRDVEARRWVTRRGFVAVYALVALAIAVGIVNGIARNGFGAAFSDLNAYLYFLLLPAFMIALRDRERRPDLAAVTVGAAAATAALTLGLFVLFTHPTPEPVLRFVYKWVRDYGMGEITRAPGGFYRVFFQAHVYALICLPWLAFASAASKGRERIVALAALAAVMGSVVFVSFSRTFWLAAAVAFAAALAVVVLRPAFRGRRVRSAAVLAAIALASVAVPFLLSRSVGGAAFGRVTDVAGEAAASSRMNLLKVMWPAIMEHPWLGSGFGKELAYVTLDPRLLAYFPDGRYTTSAFEWGWLDFWLKMGILGPLAFLMLVATLLRLAWSAIEAGGDGAWIGLALGTSTLAVAAAHALSPWLNHPLGIGFVLFAYACLVAMEDERTRPATAS